MAYYINSGYAVAERCILTDRNQILSYFKTQNISVVIYLIVVLYDTSTMSNDAQEGTTRVHTWVQNFIETEDNETLRKLGRNFEYLLDNVDEWEAGNIGLGDLPTLNKADHFLQLRSVGFGCHLAALDAELYIVSDETGSFLGAYGTETHATDRADDNPAYTVTPVGVETPPVRPTFETLDTLGETYEHLAETFEFVLDNWDAFRAGTLSPDDFPHFNQNMKWFIAYNILFGMLWEFSYPSLHGLFDEDNSLQAVYWSSQHAEDALAERDETMYLSRLSVVDGDVGLDELEQVF
jgi:hypothetical protein